MTENKAIEILKLNRPFAYSELQNAVDVAINTLEEIQQYRAIGTVEKIKEELDRLRNDNECQGLYFTLEERQDLARQSRELLEYQAIGTVEEFRGLKEKDTPKKVTGYKYHNRDCTFYGHCPTCDAPVENGMGGADNVCKKCNQALDWGPGFKRLECE